MLKPFEPAKFQERGKFHRWQDDRKGENDRRYKPASLLIKLDNSSHDAAVVSMPKLLDFENRQKDRCGKEQKGRQSRGGSPLAGSLGFGRVGDRRPATSAGVTDQLLLGIRVGLVW